MTFGVDPDTHIDSLEQAEAVTIEGTSKWSCKLTITGKQSPYAETKNLYSKYKKIRKLKHNTPHYNKLTTHLID